MRISHTHFNILANANSAPGRGPFHVSEDWNIITRTILAFVWLPPLSSGDSRTSGISDVQVSAFLSRDQFGWNLARIDHGHTIGQRGLRVGLRAAVERIDRPAFHQRTRGIVHADWHPARLRPRAFQRARLQPSVVHVEAAADAVGASRNVAKSGVGMRARCTSKS